MYGRESFSAGDGRENKESGEALAAAFKEILDHELMSSPFIDAAKYGRIEGTLGEAELHLPKGASLEATPELESLSERFNKMDRLDRRNIREIERLRSAWRSFIHYRNQNLETSKHDLRVIFVRRLIEDESPLVGIIIDLKNRLIPTL